LLLLFGSPVHVLAATASAREMSIETVCAGSS
jgi:hypothetical protein